MHWHPNMLEKPLPAADMHLSAEMAAARNAVNPWWTGIGNFHNFAAWMKQPL